MTSSCRRDVFARLSGLSAAIRTVMTPVARRGARAARVIGIGMALGAALIAAPALANDKRVNIYNWSDYIDPAMLKKFEEETGIKVVYDTYDNNEIVESKLLAGRSGYDVVSPTAPNVQRLIRAGVLRKLDKAQLPNLKHAWPTISERLAVYDPGNAYAVNYMWGTTGLGMNVKKVREALGPDAPLDSLDLLLKPEVVGKLKGCGVMILDASEDVLPGVLRYIGRDPDSKKPEDLQAAADALGKVRGDIRKLHSSEYIANLANGDVCLAFGYSGDVLQARKRAKAAGAGVEVGYVIPKEGAQMWFDNFVIPADAPNPEAAHAFINFMLRPDVAAANTNFISYANGVGDSRDKVRPEILNDVGVYPDDATMSRLFTVTSPDDRTQRVITRLWTRLRSGR